MDNKPKKGILIAFGELFLKSSSVQDFFKKKLIQNISFFFKKAGLDFKIYLFRERIFIEVSETKKAIKTINNVFGIAWYAEALFFEKAGLKEINLFISENYQKWIKEDETFALRLRNQGEAKQSGEKIINQIASKIKRKVDLTKPKKEIFIEIRKQGWYLYFKKRKGLAGMPNGTSGKVLALISGGIDSLPASYLTVKRGAKNIWLHFHSFPLVSKKSIDKTKDLAKVFLNYQPGLKVYFFPFSEIQRAIKLKVLAKYRILIYRRLMLKIAQEIARKENCLALVTGESLAQVSSQTLANINITEKATSCLILRPLIGMDKEEIIKLAKKIKTFEISIKPQEDCCTLFTPKHASAGADLKEIEKIEKQLNLDKLIKQVFQKIEIVQF
jgi:tRNA uracil 4-sulfurtransferase